ncbi:MAG: hypothetical protein QGH11_04355, partial [Pirellulaceae bacterium]|nr:hypothetical protein [Pirellulaceae bacterium]
MTRNLLVALLGCSISSLLPCQLPAQTETGRRYHEIEKDLRQLLTLEATAQSEQERLATVYEMLPL